MILYGLLGLHFYGVGLAVLLNPHPLCSLVYSSVSPIPDTTNEGTEVAQWYFVP